MKLTTTIAFAAATLFAGSAMAFQDSMVDYPQNVSYEQQQTASRAQINADLAANTVSVQADHTAYPTAYADAAPQAQQLTRVAVREELAQFIGNNFRIGVSPAYPERG